MYYIAHHMDIEEIGLVIRKRRDAKQLTQKELATMSGVHLRSINNIESGKGNPSVDTILKLAYVLNLELILRVE